MYNSRIRNIELPENLFSNLGEIKSKKNSEQVKPSSIIMTSTDEIDEINNIEQYDTDIKLTNYSNKKEYRDRIDKMYKDIKVKPVDNEIDNVLYFNNYNEQGIVIKPRISSLKHFWTEYRLISNEKNTEKNTEKHSNPITSETQKIDNFDELFEALSQRVSEINKYIDELKEMKANIDIRSNELEEAKEKLDTERNEFLNYKKDEEIKIKEEKENLKINFARLQTIIDDLDQKLENIDKKNEN